MRCPHVKIMFKKLDVNLQSQKLWYYDLWHFVDVNPLTLSSPI
jgi:hypothetical protein